MGKVSTPLGPRQLAKEMPRALGSHFEVFASKFKQESINHINV